jgi:hypothetical protein
LWPGPWLDDRRPSIIRAAFVCELRSALHKIRERTDVTRQRYSGDGEATVWRLLLPKIRHHVYYRRYEHAGMADVLLVANAIAESGPDL